MEYDNCTDLKTVTVGAKIVEYGNEIWQISNIAGVRNHDDHITIDEPEPKFDDEKPGLIASYLWSIIVVVSGLYIGLKIREDVVYIGLAVLVSIVCIYFYIIQIKFKKWKKRKVYHDTVHKIWYEFKHVGFTLHSLVMVTNSGEKSILYSFEDGVIINIMDEIKRAMLKPTPKKNTFKINVVKTEGATIKNVGSTIYQQVIKGVA